MLCLADRTTVTTALTQKSSTPFIQSDMRIRGIVWCFLEVYQGKAVAQRYVNYSVLNMDLNYFSVMNLTCPTLIHLTISKAIIAYSIWIKVFWLLFSLFFYYSLCQNVTSSWTNPCSFGLEIWHWRSKNKIQNLNPFLILSYSYRVQQIIYHRIMKQDRLCPISRDVGKRAI